MLSGWGRYPRAACRLIDAESTADAQAAIVGSESLIARGNGRSYGDAALNPLATLRMAHCNRVLSFDSKTGTITCESGVLLADIVERFVPQGWFPPVTPGTKFVTIGGMIAADVHGKNHHGAGSFCDHVASLDLATADGNVVRCSQKTHPELFAATRGGMGLTGVILQATFRMMPIETRLIRRETQRARNLGEVMAQFEQSSGATYSVAWIDCLSGGDALGRAVLYTGEHVGRQEAQASGQPCDFNPPRKSAIRVPFDFPSFALNRWSVRAFNALYYGRARPGTDLVDLDSYFYPLDALLEWNRIYGAGGFFQYQCVFPKAASREGLTKLVEKICEAGSGSFLTVLKLFGPQNGYLSFPMEGYSLALDFRADTQNLRLANELDAIVVDHGGRLYLAKDSRMNAAMLRGYAELERFRAVRAAVDPHRKFSSLQSQRLGL